MKRFVLIKDNKILAEREMDTYTLLREQVQAKDHGAEWVRAGMKTALLPHHENFTYIPFTRPTAEYITSVGQSNLQKYRLAGGEVLWVEYTLSFGPMVTKIEDEKGYWHCSQGLDKLPRRFKWAWDWTEKGGSFFTYISPKFDLVK